ncbi:Putative pentatricopeptide repeat-containing protein [Striga hermonthica]|uniref:Pentatricopeptide repeat-containing protein n=1 Tax=Striga hermonthica TaxID=68872 RepID=A0A9N7R2B6_STRHE|nr:Putative pentatricopeptide repeat-containing protein [Striga hermonthica]
MRSLKEGLKLQARAITSGRLSTTVAANQLINLYSKHGLTDDARNLFDKMPHRNVFSWNTIINAYIKSRNLRTARALFESSPYRDSVTYNSMISGYTRLDGHETEAIELFARMQLERDGPSLIDEFTLTTMLNLAAKVKILRYGTQVHLYMVKTGNDSSGFAQSSLIDMYSKCGSFLDASKVVVVVNGCGFGGWVDLVVKNALVAACCREGEMKMAHEIFLRNPELNDSVSWNTMISGYAQNGFESQAVELFRLMVEKGIELNEHTFASLLAACSCLKSLNLGKEVHVRVLKNGLFLNPFVSSGIVDIYSKCGEMSYAERVNESIGVENVFAMTSMIVGYSTRGEMSKAKKLFDSLSEKNFVVWTAVISGHVKLQQCDEAFDLFREYTAREEKNGFFPDGVILVSLLGACATQASVDPGRQIHAYILRTGIQTDEKKTISALIDMYSKCGFILYARRIFPSVDLRDTVIYNVMISGLAHHGFEREAIECFEEMTGNGRHKPDAVTYIAILSACRHCGLVEAGEKYFSEMEENYGIAPEMDHYACMVDLYGRSNMLEKAVDFMDKMPFEPDSIMVSAFLNACRENRNVELARMAERKLDEVERGADGARYFQVASVYASGGEWEEKGRVMRRIREMEAKKLAGCSWVRAGNGLRVFTSGDRLHCEAEGLDGVLGFLIDEMCDKDCVDDSYVLMV